VSTTVPVPTRDCVGIDVTKNGHVVASYDAHNGYVDVDNKGHRRLLERTFGSRKQFAMSTFGVRATKTCSSCRRLNFASNDICPSCGADITSAEVTVNVTAGS
jgi:hypothetical protein